LDHALAPRHLAIVRALAAEDRHRVPDRRQRISQLMRERGEEFIALSLAFPCVIYVGAGCHPAVDVTVAIERRRVGPFHPAAPETGQLHPTLISERLALQDALEERLDLGHGRRADDIGDAHADEFRGRARRPPRVSLIDPEKTAVAITAHGSDRHGVGDDTRFLPASSLFAPHRGAAW